MRFKKGEKVILDSGRPNQSEVTVINQTPLLVITKVTDGSSSWDVMTVRLSKLKE
jgi:hypothetical protein